MSDLNQTFAALADPGRRAILERLLDGEATVGDLTLTTGLSQPTVSKHVKILREAGLIFSRVDGNRRPSAIDPEAFVGVEKWLELFGARMESNFNRLDDLLAEFLDPPDA